jgi:metal-responsive CopG/Arc/MetJ family transcriptional regulator
MGKANISFPDGMLEEIDRRAAATGTTRSAFIQEAAARYIAELEYTVERDERAERIERAKEGMRRIGASMPPGPTGVEIIRKMRDATPSWLDDRRDADE